MDSSLHEVWESAVGSPFAPIVGKNSQFTIGINLLIVGIVLSGLFGLSMPIHPHFEGRSNRNTDRSFLNVAFIGLPASLAIAFVNPLTADCRVADIFQVWSSLHDLCGWCLCIRYPSIINSRRISFHRINIVQ
jgi:hypothetical protein